jgi:signal transduction histidine kinase
LIGLDLDFLLPPSTREDKVLRRRFRSMMLSQLILVGIMTIFFVLYLFIRGTPSVYEGILLCLNIFVPLFGILFIRQTGQVSVVLYWITASGLILVTCWAWISGGVDSPAIPWVFVLMASTSTYGLIRASVLALILVVCSILVLLYGTYYHLIPVSIIGESNAMSVWFLSMIFAVVFLFFNIVWAIGQGQRTKHTLNVLRQKSEQASQAKSEFLSTVSHELRTPLTSIKGSLGMLQSGAVGEFSDKASSMLDVASRNSDRLVLLINDILDVEKLESGRFVFDMKPVKVSELLKEAIEANKGYGREHGVTFICAEYTDDFSVLGDKGRLMQVLSNLMSNAAKFSPNGDQINLSAETIGGSVRIAVQDNGVGIPEGFHKDVFEKFTQADASDTRQIGGTGLGLNISRSIIEQHGGTISFETEVNVETTFFFTLPHME